MVTFGLELGGEPEQDRHRGQEHRGRLAPPAGPDEPADGLREVQRGGHAGGVHADGEPRDVDAFGDHPHGDHPALAGVGERGDLPGRGRVVGQHHHGPLAGQPAQQRGVGPRAGVIARDDQAGRVGHPAADLGQPLVGRLQHPADPLPRRVQGGPPGLGDLVLGHRRAERGGDLVPGPGAPAHLAGVGQEDDRAHHAVLQRWPVAVDIVRGAALAAPGLVEVADERDGVGVAAERRAGQREPAPGRVKRLLDRVAPGQRVARVVDLVEDDQRPARVGALAVQHRVRRDLGVGHGHAGEIGRRPALGIAVRGVDRDAEPARRLRPLVLQVLGGSDDSDRGDLAPREQLGRDGQGVRRLPRAGRGDKQEVTPRDLEVRLVCGLLPPSQGVQKLIPDRGLGACSRGRKVTATAARGRAGKTPLSGRRPRRPTAGARKFPCTWGRPDSASGRGWGPRPCRTAR